MKVFRFLVFQDLKSYYKGNLDIEANTKEEALRILKKKKQKDLEEECFNWTQADEADPVGKIDVDTYSIHEI